MKKELKYKGFLKSRLVHSMTLIAIIFLNLIMMIAPAEAKDKKTPENPSGDTITQTVKNIVIVHGAFADGSGFKKVYDILSKKGYHVTVVQNPLTSLKGPIAVSCFTVPVKEAAWKTKPSYGIVATENKALNPDIERNMYKRSGAKITEIKGNHVIFISKPSNVANIIVNASEGK